MTAAATGFSRALVMIGVLCAGVSAMAETLDDARGAFAEGRFLEAADIGEALATSDSLALAARALAIHGFHLAPDDAKQPAFRRAMAAAERAVALDADNAEAHMQSAHAMGRYAQTIGPMEALGEGFADRIRAALDAALALDPDFAAAHLALAGWHAGIVDGAGGFMARVLYGATEKDALVHYDIARGLAPESNIVAFDYAENLFMLDADEHGDKARALLREAISLPAPDAYGEIIRERARDLLAASEAE